MKLTTKILSLLAVNSVLSYTIEEKLNKRLDFDLNSLGGVANCLTALDKFQECKINTSDLQNNKDIVCSSFNSEKCQQVLKGGINTIPECKDLPTEVLATSPLIFEMLSSSIGLACSKDENDNYCPLSDVIISNNGKLDQNEETVKAAIKETCKSKKCVDAAVDTLTRIETGEMLVSLGGGKFKRQVIQAQTQNESTDKSISDYKEVLEYFKSNNCTQAYTVTTETSDAYSAFKIYTALLMTFALVLPNFF